MTMRSKQWYTKASRLPNSFAKVSIGIPAHAGGGCLPRHQESADGAADFSSSAEPHPVLSVGAFSTQPSCLDNKIIEQGTDGDPAIPSRERP